MAHSGIKPSDAAVTWFKNDFKLGRKHKYAFLEIAGTEVKVTGSATAKSTLADLKKELASRKKHCYVVVDDKKIGMFIWAPVSAPKDAMVYASSSDALTTAFGGAIINCGTADSPDEALDLLKTKGVVN